jgi:hypothetical protein
MKSLPFRVVSSLSVVLGLVVACGGSTSSSGSGGAAGAGAGGSSGSTGGAQPIGGSGGLDCSTVGCAPPPMCDTGCTAACGCCSCGDGDLFDGPSGPMICQNGCFVPVATCGGLTGAVCASDEYCDFPNGCGGDDSTGVCKKRPQGCTADCPGVCGCDGKVYCNACGANAMGVDTDPTATCNAGDAGAGTTCQSDNECQPGLKCCYPCGIPGCQDQCMAPDANGQCPMFP